MPQVIVFTILLSASLLAALLLAEPVQNPKPTLRAGEGPFKITERNEIGSGHYWYYGETDQRYFSSLSHAATKRGYVTISRKDAKACASFDPKDVTTWPACRPLITAP